MTRTNKTEHTHEHPAPAPRGRASKAPPGEGNRILYFDCVGGVSGDMCLGALVDLGCPLEHLKTELARLGLHEEFDLQASPKSVHGIQGTRVTVQLNNADVTGRHLSDILELLHNSSLKPPVVDATTRVFQALGAAEAKVHGVPIERVHFHEVGAVDSIVDIVGACIALNYFGPAAVYCTPLRTGTGFIRAQHGVLPAPAPAVVNLAMDRTLEYIDHQGELTTPTGAAILCALAVERPTLKLKVKGVGYGCGTRDFEDIPNVLRVVLGEGQ